jgi:hypothetical protein
MTTERRGERGRWRGRAEGRARGKDLYRAPAATAYWPGFGFCQPLLRLSGADTVMFVGFGFGFYGSAVTCHGQCCLMLVPSTGVLWEKRREKGRTRDTPQRSVNYMCIGWIEARQRASSSERRGGLGSPFFAQSWEHLVLASGLIFTVLLFRSDEDGIKRVEFGGGQLRKMGDCT